jgi:auxin efflux carrier family protein
MWVCGAASSLAWDYAPGIPQGEAANVRLGWREKPVGELIHRTFFQKSSEELAKHQDAEKQGLPETLQALEKLDNNSGIQLVRRMSEISAVSLHKGEHGSSVAHPAMKIEGHTAPSLEPSHNENQGLNSGPPPPITIPAKFWSVAATLFTPTALAIYISLPIALVPALKSLFVLPTSPSDPYYFIAPDGNPPLYFILSTTTFVGALTVPMTLILLGASFARLKIPRPFSQKAPVWAIWWVCIAKLVFLPVIGIFFVQGLVSRSVIHKEEKVLRFVLMLLSGTPSAVR